MIISDIGFMISDGPCAENLYEQWFRLSITNPAQKAKHMSSPCFPLLSGSGGETYGNVGRCLQFNGNINDALICYKKSLRKLEDQMNIGYGYLWYAECMITNSHIDIALWFYMKAHNIWKLVSPIRASSVDRKINAIVELNPTLANIAEMTEREVDRYCQRIIESN